MDRRCPRFVTAALLATSAVIAAGCGTARTLGGDSSPAGADGQPRIPPKGPPPFFTVEGNAVDVLAVVDKALFAFGQLMGKRLALLRAAD